MECWEVELCGITGAQWVIGQWRENAQRQEMGQRKSGKKIAKKIPKKGPQKSPQKVGAIRSKNVDKVGVTRYSKGKR